jgi:hypothetical protein
MQRVNSNQDLTIYIYQNYGQYYRTVFNGNASGNAELLIDSVSTIILSFRFYFKQLYCPSLEVSNSLGSDLSKLTNEISFM